LVDTSVNPPALAQVSVAEGDKKALTSPPANSFGDYLPVISPDGQWLAFSRFPGISLAGWTVVSFPVAADSQQQQLPPQPRQIIPFSRCAWTADSAQVVCVEASSGGPRLVRVPVHGPGKPEPIMAAGNNANSPSIARQAGKLAY